MKKLITCLVIGLSVGAFTAQAAETKPAAEKASKKKKEKKEKKEEKTEKAPDEAKPEAK